MNTSIYQVTGMHCSSCSMLVTMNLQDLPGVESAECNHATGRTEVTYDTSTVSSSEIIGAIRDAGYDAELVG